MSAYGVAIVVLLAIGVSLVIISNLLFYTVIGELNARRTEQIGTLFVNIRMGRILRLHAELFPESRKRQQISRLLWTGFVIMAAGFIVDVIHYGH